MTLNTTTKVPPHNIDSERALLGSIILNDSALDDVIKIILSNAFYDKKHQIIFSAMLTLKQHNEPIDLLTLSNHLEKTKQLEAVGGSGYFAELVNLVPSSANAKHYAKIVQTKYARRQMIQLAEKMVSSSYDEEKDLGDLLVRSEKAIKEVAKINKGEVKRLGDADIDLIIKQLQNEINETKDEELKQKQLDRLAEVARLYKGEDELINSSDALELLKNRSKRVIMPTKIEGIDTLIQGFSPGQLITIGALPKAGKTTMCMELTINQREFNPVWIPFEEGTDELLEKFIERGETPPVFFSPKNIEDRSIKFVEAKVIEGKSKYDSKIFYIDNLDWLVDMRSANLHQDISYTMMELKRIARVWKVCIVLIAHVNKKERSTDSPDYSDLSGSSTISRVSDTVIMMWRETKKENGELIITNNLNVSVQLARRGKPGNVHLTFENGHYREFDWKTKDEDLEKTFNF
jgi:replicative DNA helicase